MIRNDLPISLVNNPELGAWIGFEEHGLVRLATGKVELGQGILTALSQIAAEELEVAPARIRIVSGDTRRTPEEGMTAGSQSVEASGGAIRLVCAEVRALAINEAARVLECSAQELSIDDGEIRRGGTETTLTYWNLKDLDLQRPATGSVPPRPIEQLRVIGQNLPRVDLPRKVMGGGGFIHDLKPPGMLHARVLRGPSRSSQLAGIDEGLLRRLASAPIDIVRIGDFAAIVAENEAAAERALAGAARAVSWTGGTPMQADGADPYLLRTLPSIDSVRIVEGRIPAGGEASTITATYSRPYLAHASIGPCCALAIQEGDRLTVWSHSQGVGPLRQSIARALRLDPGCVHVMHHQAAGCYGHNGADDAALDAAIVACQMPGRTIRVQWSREDEFTAGPFGAASVVKAQAAVNGEGFPVSWALDIWSPPHGRRPGANGGINLLSAAALPDVTDDGGTADVPDAVGGGGNRNSVALYDLPPQRITHHLIPHVPLRTSSLRGLGAQANVFAIESFIDELAVASGHCPLAYRLTMLTDPRARRVIDAVAAMASWHRRGAGGEGVGLGLAFSRYKNKAAYLAAIVEVEVEMEVNVRHVWCAVDAGLVINPDGAANQIEGGVIQAVSWSLKEQVRASEAGIASRDWENYPILRFSEVPEVSVSFVGDPADPPLGVGEAAVGPVTAAIANATAHALGIRVRDLPLSREHLMASMLSEGNLP